MGHLSKTNYSQSCIISARVMDEAVKKALELAAEDVCTAESGRPCGMCRSCRKVRNGSHPDVIKIGLPLDDKGKPKKEIVVDQIRQMISDAYIMPNEADHKIYVIENADLMNIPAQNAALKMLEEPPARARIFLCVVNVQELLPTVRSRCTLITCAATDPANEQANALSLEYLETVARGPASALCSFCFANEGMDIRTAREFFAGTMTLIADMLAGRCDRLGMSSHRLVRLYALSEKCFAYLKVNTGVKHVFGLLAVQSDVEDKEGKQTN